MKNKHILMGAAAVLVLAGLRYASRIHKNRAPQFPEPVTSASFSMVTDFKKTTICIPVTTQKLQKIRVRVWDYDNPKTFFTNRWMRFAGTEVFEIMLPMTSKKVMITVASEEPGNSQPFQIGMISCIPLKTQLDKINIMSPKVRSFVKFAQDFAFNASYLDPNKTYKSDDNEFFIELLPVIETNGKALNTSARIDKSTGKIQVSKRDFDLYTIPMRMAVLLHEFSHYNLNENIDDESEADLNGLLIYLGLGFPRVEAMEAWADVFQSAQTKQNKEREKIIKKFIDDFEDGKIAA